MGIKLHINSIQSLNAKYWWALRDYLYCKLFIFFCPFIQATMGRVGEYFEILFYLLEYVTILGDYIRKVSCLNDLLRKALVVQVKR